MKTGGVEWEKVLWKTQEFGDNYTHPQYFLESLKKNPNFKPYTYWSLVLLACAITQQVASVFIFLGIFLQLKENTLNPRTLLWSSIGAFCVGYGCWTSLSPRRFPVSVNDRKLVLEKRMTPTLIGWFLLEHRSTDLKTLKSSILVFLALMSLSPVLRTLTAATSSDSIWALAAILFFLNILLADYSVMPTNEHGQERLSSVLSMNAAVSGSVVLASRLSNDMSLFAFVLCSIVLFSLFPLLRRLIQGTSLFAWVALTFLLGSSAVVLATYVSDTFVYLCLSASIVVTFVAPAILIWAQKFKNEIRGPWDVATPIVN